MGWLRDKVKNLKNVADYTSQRIDRLERTTYQASISCLNCYRDVEVVIPRGMSAQVFMNLNSFVCAHCGCAVNKVKANDS